MSRPKNFSAGKYLPGSMFLEKSPGDCVCKRVAAKFTAFNEI
jgi:hypothetical protein